MTALFGLSILARLPLAMLSIGLLVHTQAATGEYTAAGLVAGAFALAQGVGGPALGRAADRRGQFAVLAAAALLSATALIVTSVLPHDVPVVLRVALAAAAGAALPPVGACFRAPAADALTAGPAARVYAKDTAAVEVTWVAGPPVVLALGAAVSTGAALAAIGVLLAASTLAFAASKPSRAWRPEPRDDGRARRPARPRAAHADRGPARRRASSSAPPRSPSPPSAATPPARCSGCGDSAR